MEWTGRYEALRAHATGETLLLDLVPLGLTLLRRRGVAAWMQAESSALEADREHRGERALRNREWSPNAGSGGPGAVRSELVLLLAGTALLAAQGGTR